MNDANNRQPTIVDGEKDVAIPEKVTKYDVAFLRAKDDDRDEAFHTVVFKFDAGISGPASNCFDISEDGVPQNTISYSLKVTLTDINDNAPTILNKTLECSESFKKNDVLSNIIAEDIDEGVNAEVNFHLVDVTPKSKGDKQLTVEDLHISSDDYKTATLTFLSDLKGYYGEYDIIVNTSDNGVPMQYSLNTLSLSITKFNFHAPAFVFPTTPSEIFTLSEVQSLKLGEPLKLYNQEDLPDLQVNDFQNNKWDITFEITKQDGSSDLFTVEKFGIFKARLQVTRLPNQDDMKTTHTITIEASVKKSKLDNEEAISISTNVKIKFFSSKEEPEFDQNDDTVSFDEYAPSEHPSPDLPVQIGTAKFPSGVDLPVYYKLLDNTDYFDLNETSGSLSVKKELHYNDHPYFDIKIAACKNPNSITTPSEKSTLNLHVKVEPLNIHKPVFHPSKFNGALLNSYKEGTTIVTVTASDEDAIDDGKLTFSIGEIKCQKSVKAPEITFAIDKTRGTITSAFRVTSDMSGYCRMNVYVEDSIDKYNSHHTVSTTVQINIISTDELVRFTFLNEDSFISENQEKITAAIDVIFEKYKYKSNLADLKYDKEWRNTTVDYYFLDSNQIPVLAKEILGNLTDFDSFLSLKKSLAGVGVNLGNFPVEYPQDVEDYIKIWLIASTIVLATFLMLVSIAFFFRNRALTQRISNLSTTKFGSQDSGLNRAGLAAPTTNKNAVEGSNPVFSNQMGLNGNKENDLEIDRRSINSSDSDLFGVENNPEFNM
ncbi:hypothetical protein WA026_007372 [Henosepilachna vigintioctopunctata]|uniref:Cadherin domain-containing protein n=1 Tax=Henosepilachna vigintioctopunctata TaxID=420089 RepID=A0AAW1UPQ9_9CUCU